MAQGSWEGHRACLRGGDTHPCTGQVSPSPGAWQHEVSSQVPSASGLLWCCPPASCSHHKHFPPAHCFPLSLLTNSRSSLPKLCVLIFAVPLAGVISVFCPSVLLLDIFIWEDAYGAAATGLFVSAPPASLCLCCNFSLTLQKVQQGAIDAGSHPVMRTSKPSLRIITKKFLPRINEWLLMMNRYSMPLSRGVW